jgi:hypothetical protein
MAGIYERAAVEAQCGFLNSNRQFEFKGSANVAGHAMPEAVAQSCTLPYRRIEFCEALKLSVGPKVGGQKRQRAAALQDAGAPLGQASFCKTATGFLKLF